MLMPNGENKTNITHPLIRDAYFKQACASRGKSLEDVLVLEIACERNSKTSLDNNLYALLGDLADLKQQAETKFGHIDRIDIRTH